jgi:hypothetical protein
VQPDAWGERLEELSEIDNGEVERAAEIRERFPQLVPRPTPLGAEVSARFANCIAYQWRERPHSTLLTVLLQLRCIEGKLWLHLSVCGHQPGLKRGHPPRRRVPTWAELKSAKEAFLGDRKAVSVMPPKAEYVNAEEVLHLFAAVEHDPLPDFRIRTSDGAVSL